MCLSIESWSLSRNIGRTSRSKLGRCGESGRLVMGTSLRRDSATLPFSAAAFGPGHLPGHVASNLPAPQWPQASQISPGCYSSQITRCDILQLHRTVRLPNHDRTLQIFLPALVTSRTVPSLGGTERRIWSRAQSDRALPQLRRRRWQSNSDTNHAA
jgi:hypothetical protein